MQQKKITTEVFHSNLQIYSISFSSLGKSLVHHSYFILIEFYNIKFFTLKYTLPSILTHLISSANTAPQFYFQDFYQLCISILEKTTLKVS